MQGYYPTPLVIEPLSSQHTHTFIILHGRGSNAERFGRELLASANLAARLPTVKFVFPTASKRRSTILKKMPINQWFDNYSLDDPNERTDLQIQGLSDTARFLRQLIDQEAHILDSTGQTGYHKVILGGLSQGCAASLFAMLGGQLGESGNERLGAFFGMSGWLPFAKQLNDMFRTAARNSENEEMGRDKGESDSLTDYLQQLDVEESEGSARSDESDSEHEDEIPDDNDTSEDGEPDIAFSDTESEPFTSQTTQDQASFNPFESVPQEVRSNPFIDIMDATNLIRDILGLPLISLTTSDIPCSDEDSDIIHLLAEKYTPILQTPVFLGHGSADPKVSVRLGGDMARFLSDKLKMDVTWKEYEGFGHWYKVPDEIDDLLGFLQQKVGLHVVEI